MKKCRNQWDFAAGGDTGLPLQNIFENVLKFDEAQGKSIKASRNLMKINQNFMKFYENQSKCNET